MLSVVGLEAVDEAPLEEAPIGLYIYKKLRKTRTLKWYKSYTLESFKPCTYKITYGCLYQYH